MKHAHLQLPIVRAKQAGLEKCDHLAKFGFPVEVMRAHSHPTILNASLPFRLSCMQDLLEAGFNDAFAYAILHKIDAKRAASEYVIDRNNM